MTTNQHQKDDKQEHKAEQKNTANKSETKLEAHSVEITKDLIKHVANLARLNLTEKELEKFVPELKEIISTFSQLNEVNVDNVEPSFQPVELKNALRDDTVEKSFTNEEALSNSEHKKEGYFKGPSVI